jgi:D-alanyl-D-alanine carboxypeptidase/D-alanyl-D-alanine-endopeptidase (penicillin-binding protein 4)
MGSNMKLFTVGTALDVLGPDRTFTTPVHQLGDDIVLVASGDFVMGGRNAGDGDELAYSVPPQGDANGLPGAKPAPGDPLAGLDDLAEQVRASGVSSVDGEVLIDDRLFETWDSRRGVINPLVINDNLFAVLTTAGAVGEGASLETIPATDAFTLLNEVTTVPDGEPTRISITAGEANTLIVSGTVSEGTEDALNVYQVDDPTSYGRTLFVEALERAGVAVAADPLAVEDSAVLPDPGAYSDENRLAWIESPPLREMAELVWKISHNEGAMVTLCLLAAEAGSTDCLDGFAAIRARTEALGIDPHDTWFIEGAGGDTAQTTAQAITDWLRWMDEQPWGAELPSMLPILGVDGSLTDVATESPARGLVQAKTGTNAALDGSNGRLLIKGKALAGFMESEDGTRYVFGLYMSNASFDGMQGQFTVNDDMGDVAAAIEQSL